VAQIFYLGPSGTFTHDAARRYFLGKVETDFLPCATPQEVVRKVAEHKDDFGVVPIENSVHGEVITTLDALLFEFADVFIIGEVSLPISFSFFSVSPSATPRIVLSHPHALAQCKKFIQKNVLTEQGANSTADACRIVAERGDPSYGAIASPFAGGEFGLHMVETNIEDFNGAHTRFLVLSQHFHAPIGDCKCMLAILPPSNSLGVLAELTGAFYKNRINILSIHSRPTRIVIGQYVFIITAEGTPIEGPTKKALRFLCDKGYRLKVLGAYPSPGQIRLAAPYPSIPGLLSRRDFEALIERTGGT
jgi:chorismate mutase / prephenate dehydratase